MTYTMNFEKRLTDLKIVHKKVKSILLKENRFKYCSFQNTTEYLHTFFDPHCLILGSTEEELNPIFFHLHVFHQHTQVH